MPSNRIPDAFYHHDWAFCKGCWCGPCGSGACRTFRAQFNYNVGVNKKGEKGCGKKRKE